MDKKKSSYVIRVSSEAHLCAMQVFESKIPGARSVKDLLDFFVEHVKKTQPEAYERLMAQRATAGRPVKAIKEEL